ncbi:acyl carrier protein [Microbaculum sp. FT89]|uniref:acyl carrier protein n=1 Tax=Microbaculum sp. FT89 TaxID=3447298 RepID=UPI003F535E2B
MPQRPAGAPGPCRTIASDRGMRLNCPAPWVSEIIDPALGGSAEIGRNTSAHTEKADGMSTETAPSSDDASFVATIEGIVSKVTGRSDVKLDGDTALIDDEILDSLDWSVFLLDLEKHYDIKIPDETVDEQGLQTVGKLVSFIRSSL